MVPYGAITAPRRGYWDDNATGGHIDYSCYDACSEYLRMGPEKITTPDPRKDPKMWKIWFREFLTSILPAPREIVTVLPKFVPAHQFLCHCRSGPPPEREWKMKSWVQALKSQ
jgi:hypothetical protein